MSRSGTISHEPLPSGKVKNTAPPGKLDDLLESDGGPLSDLIVLCESCHKTFHGIAPEPEGSV